MMRDKLEFFRRIQIQLAVAMALYPLHWLVAAWLDSSRIGSAWLFPAGATLAGIMVMRIPGKMRPAFGVSVCLVLLAGTLINSTVIERWVWFFGAALCSVQIIWSLPVASDSRKELSGFWIGAGIASHVTTQILLLTEWAEDLPGWSLRLSFFCYVLLVMLSVNRQSLMEASGKRRAVPRDLKRRNMLLVGALFGVSLLGGALPSAIGMVKEVIVDVLRWIEALIAKLLTRIAGEAPNTVQQVAHELPPMVQEGEVMRQLPPVLETMILYIGAAISVFFLGMILFRIGKKLVRFGRESWDLFGRFLSAASEDYVDEIMDIRDTGSVEQISRRKRRRMRYKEDPSLPPSEQVRRRFRYLRYDHPDWMPGATAREKLPERAAHIYEWARYSERDVSSEDARVFIDMAKDI